MKMPKTKEGAIRQWDAIINRAYRAMTGGTSLGMDWPTFAATFPDDAAQCKRIEAAYPGLPSRRK